MLEACSFTLVTKTICHFRLGLQSRDATDFAANWRWWFNSVVKILLIPHPTKYFYRVSHNLHPHSHITMTISNNDTVTNHSLACLVYFSLLPLTVSPSALSGRSLCPSTLTFTISWQRSQLDIFQEIARMKMDIAINVSPAIYRQQRIVDSVSPGPLSRAWGGSQQADCASPKASRPHKSKIAIPFFFILLLVCFLFCSATLNHILVSTMAKAVGWRRQ